MANNDIALMAHLMRRAGFGAPREELEKRAAKGYEATVEELLHPEDQPPVDRFEMMRYHPWAWRPGTLQGMGAAEWLPRYGQYPSTVTGKDVPVLAPSFRSRSFQGRPL